MHWVYTVAGRQSGMAGCQAPGQDGVHKKAWSRFRPCLVWAASMLQLSGREQLLTLWWACMHLRITAGRPCSVQMGADVQGADVNSNAWTQQMWLWMKPGHTPNDTADAEHDGIRIT